VIDDCEMTANPPVRGILGKRKTGAADHGREAWILLLNLLRADQGPLLKIWAEFDLSSAQGELLCSLEPEETAAMVSLARTLHCHDSNVTGLVDRLEQRGLIERRSDPKDRRVKLIALTKEGESLRCRLLERLYDPLPFIASLSAKDKITLRDILARATETAKSSSVRK
jgi:MarR family transcriptional regulator, organic hydroperoxide resistance regulator